MRDATIFDLDGTIANVNHRLPLIFCDKPNWQEFYRACVRDVPNEWCVQLIKSLARDGIHVNIVTCRSKEVYKETVDWLMLVFGNTKNISLHMIREVDDNTPDTDLKREFLGAFDKDSILFVVEDRPRVVDMYRQEGLTCLQCGFRPEYKRNKE